MKKYFFFIIFFILNFGNSQKIINKNEKYGVSLENKEIISTDYDSIQVVNEFVLSFKHNKTNIYNLKGLKLREGIKSYYYFSKDVMQIIESSNKMIFISPKNEIISSAIIERLNKNTFSFTPNDELGNNRITKYIIVNRKNVSKESISYLNDSVRNSVKIISAPKNLLFINLINNKKKIEFERNWYKLRYGAISPDYIIVKNSKNFGLWDLEEERYIIPTDFNELCNYQSYIYLQKNGLATFYPNIGTEPKYKKLEPYMEYFARFELPNGKKGWVDRKGKEYFDE